MIFILNKPRTHRYDLITYPGFLYIVVSFWISVQKPFSFSNQNKKNTVSFRFQHFLPLFCKSKTIREYDQARVVVNLQGSKEEKDPPWVNSPRGRRRSSETESLAITPWSPLSGIAGPNVSGHNSDLMMDAWAHRLIFGSRHRDHHGLFRRAIPD